MKIVYVICLNKPQSYWRMLLVSALSCKLTNPEKPIWLVTDDTTCASLSKELAEAERLGVFDKVASFSVPDSGPVARSRLLKTSLRSRVEGDFIYIDVDTIVQAPIDLNGWDGDFLAVPNLNSDEVILDDEVYEACEALAWSRPEYPHVNGGVFAVRDTAGAQEIFQNWYMLWCEQVERGFGAKDQTALNEALRRSKASVVVLPHKYNAQICKRPQLADGAIILHVFESLSEDHPLIPTCWDDLWSKGDITFESVAARLRRPFYKVGLFSKPVLSSILRVDEQEVLKSIDWRMQWLGGHKIEGARRFLKLYSLIIMTRFRKVFSRHSF